METESMFSQMMVSRVSHALMRQANIDKGRQSNQNLDLVVFSE